MLSLQEMITAYVAQHLLNSKKPAHVLLMAWPKIAEPPVPTTWNALQCRSVAMEGNAASIVFYHTMWPCVRNRRCWRNYWSWVKRRVGVMYRSALKMGHLYRDSAPGMDWFAGKWNIFCVFKLRPIRKLGTNPVFVKFFKVWKLENMSFSPMAE